MFKILLATLCALPILFLVLLGASDAGLALLIGCGLLAGVAAGAWRNAVNRAFPPIS